MVRYIVFVRGGDSYELMCCDSSRIPSISLYSINHSMPSRHVLLSIAVVACAQGGVENVINGRKR